MKTHIQKIKKLSFFLIAIISVTVASAQDKETKIKSMVEKQQYVFKAQTVMPTTGSVRNLTSEYDLKIDSGSVIVYLPYFGRAYSAPISSSQGGIQFTSKNFQYSQKSNRKGWDILIKPNDVKEVQQLSLNITTSGNATLRVISLNRQDISFSGYIEQLNN